ncbi:MAG: UDP-N-acetylglucosamine--N-acetylmuramyl-(pentapeptide) pyrophosphoryl-undecaprenol N-acetylglucosamine transferase [Ilumatobacteraceae bacterium]
MTSRQHPIFAVIAGGGTSGHILPALAIAELLVEAGHSPDSIHFFGSDRGAEFTILPDSPYPHTFLRVDGFQRGLNPRSLARNFRMVPMMWRAIRSARALLVELQPKVVISVGGYASVPATRAAHQLAIPVVTCSYDRRPGIATRLQSRYAAVSAVAYLPTKLHNAQLTGAPVRAAIRHLRRSASRNEARARLNIAQDRRLIVLMGGSLGSAALNSVLRGVVELWVNRTDLSILHLSGVRYFNDPLPNLGASAQHIEYVRLAYCENMVDVYAAADLIVSRAGASSVAEIATVGVPSILVPWKQSAENHQQLNANWLVERGGAVTLSDPELSVDSLAKVIADLIDDPRLLAQLRDRAYELGAVHRDSSIARVICEVAR